MNYPTVYFNLHDFIAVDLPDSKLTRQFIVAAQKSLDKSVEERIWYLKKNRILKARDVRNGNRWLPWHFNADGSPKEAMLMPFKSPSVPTGTSERNLAAQASRDCSRLRRRRHGADLPPAVRW